MNAAIPLTEPPTPAFASNLDFFLSSTLDLTACYVMQDSIFMQLPLTKSYALN